MDPESFRKAMQLLASLPSAQGVDPAHRYESYAEAFRGDSGPLFLAACRLGFQTTWRFFPTPPEIREQMVAIEDAARRQAERERCETAVARATEHASAETERRACRNDDCDLCTREAALGGPRRNLRALPPPDALAIAEAKTVLRRARSVLDAEGADAPRGGEPQRVGAIIDLAQRRRPTADGGMR